MAGRLLVPVTDGIAVCDPVTGVGEGYSAGAAAADERGGDPGRDRVRSCSSSAVTPSSRWADYTSMANVGSGLPVFQCLSSACASSR